jgi:hypothetical protein
MRKQAMVGWLVTLVLLLSVSLAACQPIKADSSKATATDVTEVNKAAVRNWFAEYNALDPHDSAGFDRLVDKYYAPDYVLHDPGVPNFPAGQRPSKTGARDE